MSRQADPTRTPGKGQAGTLDRILDSARSIATRLGFANLTVRDAAAAAGVTASSANVYFGSDAELISEMLWRELISLPTTQPGARRTRSMTADLRSDALDIVGLRARTAREVQRRIHAALGPRPDPQIAKQLQALYTDALIDAGVGYAAHSRLTRSPEQVVLRILGNNSDTDSPAI